MGYVLNADQKTCSRKHLDVFQLKTVNFLGKSTVFTTVDSRICHPDLKYHPAMWAVCRIFIWLSQTGTNLTKNVAHIGMIFIWEVRATKLQLLCRCSLVISFKILKGLFKLVKVELKPHQNIQDDFGWDDHFPCCFFVSHSTCFAFLMGHWSIQIILQPWAILTALPCLLSILCYYITITGKINCLGIIQAKKCHKGAFSFWLKR